MPQPVDDCLQVLGNLLCGAPAPVVSTYWQPSDRLGSTAAGSDKVSPLAFFLFSEKRKITALVFFFVYWLYVKSLWTPKG